MSKVLRTIARRGKRSLYAEGIAGDVLEMRLTWKRRSKKPARKQDHQAASGESEHGDGAAGQHQPDPALPGRELSEAAG